MSEDTFYSDMVENEVDMDKIIRNIYSQCDETKTDKVQVSKLLDFMKPYFQANQSDLDKLKEIMDPDNVDHEVSSEMFNTMMRSWATKYNQEDSFHNISQQEFNNPRPLVESTPRKSFGARQHRVYAEAAALDVSNVERSTGGSNDQECSMERSVLEEQIKQLTYQNRKCHDELMLARSQLLSQEEQNLLLHNEIDRLSRDLKHDRETIETLMKESESLDDLRDSTLSKQRCIEKIEKQLVQYEKENQQLKVENAGLERERLKMEEKLVRTHENLGKIRKEAIELRAEINMKEEQIFLAEETKNALIAKINDLKDTVANVQESNSCLMIEKEKVSKLLQENLKRQQALMNMAVSSPNVVSPPNMYIIERTADRKAATPNISFDESATEDELLQVQYTSAFGAPAQQLSLMDEIEASHSRPTSSCDKCNEQIERLKNENSALKKSEGQFNTLLETNRHLEDVNKQRSDYIDMLLKDIEELKGSEIDLKQKDENLEELLKNQEELILKGRELQESYESLERKLEEARRENRILQKELDKYRNLMEGVKNEVRIETEQTVTTSGHEEAQFEGLEKQVGALQERLEILQKEKYELEATIAHEKTKVMSVTEELILSESIKKSLERQYLQEKDILLKEHAKEIQLERTKALSYNEELQTANDLLETQLKNALQERDKIAFDYQMQLEEITNKLELSKNDIAKWEEKYINSYDKAASLILKNQDLTNENAKLCLQNKANSAKWEETMTELEDINSLMIQVNFNNKISWTSQQKIQHLINIKDNYDQLQKQHEEIVVEKEKEIETHQLELLDLRKQLYTSLKSSSSKSDIRKTPYDRSQIKIEKMNEKIDYFQDLIKEERYKRAFLETEVLNLQNGKLAQIKVNEENKVSLILKENIIRDLTNGTKDLILECCKLKEIMFKLWKNWQKVLDKVSIENLFGELQENYKIGEIEEVNLEISRARRDVNTMGHILNVIATQNVDDIKAAQIRNASTMAWVMKTGNLSRPMSPDSPNLEALEAAMKQPTCAGDIGMMEYETVSADDDSTEVDMDTIEELNNLYLSENLEFWLTTIKMEYATPTDLDSFVDEYGLTFMLDCAGYENRLRAQFENLKDLASRLIENLFKLSSLYHIKMKKPSAFKIAMMDTVRSIFDLTHSSEQYGAIREECQRSTTIKHLLTSMTKLRVSLDKMQKHCNCSANELSSEIVLVDSIVASSSVCSKQVSVSVLPESFKNFVNTVRPRNLIRLVGAIFFLYAVYIFSTPFLLIAEPDRFPRCWSPWLDILATYFKRHHPDGIPPT